MRERRNTVIALTPITLISFVIAVIFNYCIEENFIVNVSLAVFGSSLLAVIVALIGYFSERKKVLKQYGDELITILNIICKYKFNARNGSNAQYENAKILADLYEHTFYSLGIIFYEFSPFLRKSDFNNYVYSPYKYLSTFLTVNSKQLKTIEELYNTRGLNSDFALQTFKDIEKNMFFSNEEKHNGDVVSIKTEFLMLEKLKNYLLDFTKVMNGKHKGKYNSIDVSFLEENKGA